MKLFKRRQGSSHRPEKDTTDESKAQAAAGKLAELIDNAEEFVLIVAGKLMSCIYARPVLVNAMERAQKRGVAFRILVGPHPDMSAIKHLSALWDNIYVLPEYPDQHFEVIDGQHARYERPHHYVLELPSNAVYTHVPRSAALLFDLAREYESRGGDKVSPVKTWMEARNSRSQQA